MDDPTDGTAGTYGTIWVYTYDLGGNILTKTAYARTATGEQRLLHESHSYTYGNANWKDQLNALTTQIGTCQPTTKSFQYDAVGNPIALSIKPLEETKDSFRQTLDAEHML